MRNPLYGRAIRQHGVTLIELLVTLAILAILVGVGVPGMGGLIKDARLSSQTDLLVSALNVARLEAIKQRVEVKLCPVGNADTATACSADTADWSKGWLVMKTGGTILQRIPVKNIVSVSNSSLAEVKFNPTIGSAVAATGFTLCISGRQQQGVSITASGNVSKSISTTVCS